MRPKYTVGGGVITVGQADIINSVAAVKHLVYDEKKLTMERLIQALDADFVGYEDVQAMCLAAPKYGNDDERADFCVGGSLPTWWISSRNTIPSSANDLRYAAGLRQHTYRPVGGRSAFRPQCPHAAD